MECGAVTPKPPNQEPYFLAPRARSPTENLVYIIDRIEDGFATLEGPDGASLALPERWLPAGAREGDVLQIATRRAGRESTLTLSLDEDARQKRAEELRGLRDTLPRGPGGDISL
jgi:hypothetical protein